MPVLKSKGDRPLKMSFEDQLNALIFYHLEEHVSGRHLIRVLKEDDFARNNIAPKDGIEKSSFFEAINNRGLEQPQFIYINLCSEASGILSNQFARFGDLVAIDGSLINVALSMDWADYRKNSKKANTTKTVVHEYDVNTDSIVFYDAEVLLGTPQNNNQTQKPIRLVGYRIENVDYWVATGCRDLTAEQIAEIYKLRWEIENFFAWWKRHLKGYHLIARSQYGLTVQIFGGLITYLLLAIYCHNSHGERVSIKRLRQLRIQIQNELRDSGSSPEPHFFKEQQHSRLHAKT
jgi:hypothetical protein